MATATKQARASKDAERGAGNASGSSSMEFLIDEDNAGEYHWTLVDRRGASLARSNSFKSYERAEKAAHAVLGDIGSARVGT